MFYFAFLFWGGVSRQILLIAAQCVCALDMMLLCGVSYRRIFAYYNRFATLSSRAYSLYYC